VPDWLLWLLPVPLATAGAILWAAWSSRSRGPGKAAEGIEEYARFRAALASARRPRDEDERRPG
jgi:cytochrome c-type biogenesis protein CcmH/NrfF